MVPYPGGPEVDVTLQKESQRILEFLSLVEKLCFSMAHKHAFSANMEAGNSYNDLIALPEIETKLNDVRNEPGFSARDSSYANGIHQ